MVQWLLVVELKITLTRKKLDGSNEHFEGSCILDIRNQTDNDHFTQETIKFRDGPVGHKQSYQQWVSDTDQEWLILGDFHGKCIISMAKLDASHERHSRCLV